MALQVAVRPEFRIRPEGKKQIDVVNRIVAVTVLMDYWLNVCGGRGGVE
jgi:hypothetical protein